MKTTTSKTIAFLLAATGVLAFTPAAFAQPQAPAAVTPAQIDAAEKAFQVRARSSFRSFTRTPAQRLAAAQGALSGATALAATVTLTSRAPWASGAAWLNTTLAISDTQEDYLSLLAYPDEFAPQGAIDVVIKTTPGKRYLVECSTATLGATSTRATVFAGDTPTTTQQQVKQDTYATATPGSVTSLVTPASTAAYLRIKLDIPRTTVGAAGLAVLGLDKCEVTPFS